MPRSRLYRRPDSPLWWAEYTGPDGRAHRRSTGCRDHAAAKAWLATRELDRVKADAGIPVAQRIELIKAVAEYIDQREPFWSKGWQATVEGVFRNEVIPHFGEQAVLADITRPMVEAFRAAQINRVTHHKKRKRSVGPGTVNRLMAALAAFGQWASDPERGYLLSNPFAKHKPLPEDEKVPPKLEPSEVDAFLSALPEMQRKEERTYHVRTIMTVAVDTGLRKSELARLRWEDVDLDARRLWVVSSWSRGLNKAKKTREQALTTRAVRVLRDLPKRLDGFVFGPLGDFRHSIRSAAKKAGVGHLWFHAARHIGATRAGVAGATLPELMAWGGWSSPRMVRKYAHADHRRLLALADRMETADRLHQQAKNSEAKQESA
jgi:integrase